MNIKGSGNEQVMEQLKAMSPRGTAELKTTPAPTEKAPAKKTAGKEEKVKITFFMNESTKEILQNYCNNCDMTLTAGIKKAIREMLQRENLI